MKLTTDKAAENIGPPYLMDDEHIGLTLLRELLFGLESTALLRTLFQEEICFSIQHD